MKIKLPYLFILGLFASTLSLKAQSDTSAVDPNFVAHSPKKASLLSVVLPGAGQVYNKKYWKVPIVYGAIGASLYFAFDQRRQFEEFKEAYLFRVDDDPLTTDDKYEGVYTDQNLLTLIENHRRNRDLMFVLAGFSYMLNIVDAAVDAHLYYFDVSDDLQASFRPKVLYDPYNRNYTTGIQLNIKFKH